MFNKMANPNNQNKKPQLAWNKERPWLTPGLSYAQSSNMIGERIYPKIAEWVKAERDQLHQFIQAGKITGMLVELPVAEADLFVDNEDALKAKYEEAKKVLNDYIASKGLSSPSVL